MAQSLPHLITSLVPSATSSGYVAVDAAAEITTITPKASQASAVMAHSVADLGLEAVADEPVAGLMQLVEEAEAEEEEEDEEMADAEAMEVDADDDGAPVVSQQQLANIFDIGPSFALPPIEEMFYQVAGLFSAKPIGVQ
jgi:NET1-associated nuclear protein 1 (U3 small nucleolar RNA-associated protein 17)